MIILGKDVHSEGFGQNSHLDQKSIPYKNVLEMDIFLWKPLDFLSPSAFSDENKKTFNHKNILSVSADN